jgi:hypothetical protein
MPKSGISPSRLPASRRVNRRRKARQNNGRDIRAPIVLFKMLAAAGSVAGHWQSSPDSHPRLPTRQNCNATLA